MTARLFVALELPAAARADLAAFGGEAAAGDPALRAASEEGLHLTLAFLGDRDPADIGPAAEAVGGVRAPAPALALGDALWLAPRRPHVLAVALTGALAPLHAQVVERLAAALDWEPEARPFRPHVTVARVRRGARPRRSLPDPPRATFTGEAVVLFRSHLGRGPARYEALARASLSSQ